MAKAKESVSAFVPVEEQPYEVPENWRWVTLETVCDRFQYGYTEKATFEQIGPHFIRITDIGDGIINDEHAPYCKISDDDYKKYKILKDDIFIARMGSVGENGYASHDIDGVFASYLIRLVPKITPTFVRSFLQSDLYWMQITDKSQGTTRLNVNANVLRSLKFPLPPLPEQRRIVERIESLFAKLDEAKEKAQAVVDGFESRKVAILHKAFSGELTERWRNENIITAEWETKTLDSVCKSIYDGDHMPPPKAEQGIPFLVISNVNTGHLSFNDTRFVSTTYYDSLSGTRKPEMGDVLYTLVGSYGIPVVVDDPRPFCFQRHMALLKPACIDTLFLWYLLQTQDMYNKATDIATGTAQLTVPIKGLRAMEFDCPSLPEQREIVRVLDSLLSKEQQAHDAALAVLDRIDEMKKAILAKAFRGQLGTNVASEEPAVI